MKEMEKRGRRRLPFRDQVRGKFVIAVRSLRSVDFDIGNYIVHHQNTLRRTSDFSRLMALHYQFPTLK